MVTNNSKAQASYDISSKLWKFLRISAELVDVLLITGVALVIRYFANQSLVMSGIFGYLIGFFYVVSCWLFTKNTTLGLYVTSLRQVSIFDKTKKIVVITRIFVSSLSYMPLINFVIVPTNITMFLFNPQRGLADFTGRTIVAYKNSSFRYELVVKEKSE